MVRPRRPGLGRAETRLDPVRWRRPGRGSLLRLAAIAGLLLTATLITWSGPETCENPPSRTGTEPTTGTVPALTSSKPAPPQPGSPQLNAPQPGSPPSGSPQPGSPQSGHRAAMPAGTVGVPVRLAEPTALTLVSPGDHVDLLRIDSSTRKTTAIAAAALVLGITGADDPTAGGLLLALTPAEAAKAIAAPGGTFAVLIRP